MKTIRDYPIEIHFKLHSVLSKDDWKKLFICRDCGINTLEINEYYMLKNDIWLQINGGHLKGILCIDCAEKRLGRMTTPNDFNDYPINDQCAEKNEKMRLRIKGWEI